MNLTAKDTKDLFLSVFIGLVVLVAIMSTVKTYTDHKMDVMQVKKEMVELKVKGKILTHNPDLIHELHPEEQ